MRNITNWTILHGQVYCANHNHDSLGDTVVTTALPAATIRKIIRQEARAHLTRRQRILAVKSAVRAAEVARVIIETTNTVHGCLEQGGVCGRRVSYLLADIRHLLSDSQVHMAKTQDIDSAQFAEGYEGITIRQAIHYEGIAGHVVSRGVVIA